MNNQSIEEGNILIAEFMGLQWQIFEGHLLLSNGKGKPGYAKQYNEDWSTLMPVVEKIGNMYDNKQCFDAKDLDIWNYSLFTPIDKVWLSVIQFIKWYKTKTSNGK